MIRIKPVIVGGRDGVWTVYAAFYCGKLVAVQGLSRPAFTNFEQKALEKK